MKEQYMKQVEKELNLSRKAKAEVVRDLNEIFASAAEHGETEQQVIERLGTPKAFADIDCMLQSKNTAQGCRRHR